MRYLPVHEFLKQSKDSLLLDVRSPKEYLQGHIPGAISMPLFTDQERAVVGTLYKQQGRSKAMMAALDFIGPKLTSYIQFVLEKLSFAFEKQQNDLASDEESDLLNLNEKTIYIHCWRGGMRSSSIAWLLDLYGFDTVVLQGGYKSFRHLAINEFEKERKIQILGGYTGSGKTHVLHELQKMGYQTLDLEECAGHRGSSFGAIDLPPQPTQEQFENNIGYQLFFLDPNKNLWIEDESLKIGINIIPQPLWIPMRAAEVFRMDIPLENRIQNLIKDYSSLSKIQLEEAIIRLKKKLGGADTDMALEHFRNGRPGELCRLLLKYYDKNYEFGISKRPPENIHRVVMQEQDFKQMARIVLKAAGINHAD